MKDVIEGRMKRKRPKGRCRMKILDTVRGRCRMKDIGAERKGSR